MKFFLQSLFCIVCLSLFLSCAAPNNFTAKSNRKELITVLNDSVFCISVVIKGKDYRNRHSVGTGFLIGEDLIASAFHVQLKAVELPGKFKLPDSQIVAWKRFASGEVIEFPIEIIASDEESDLAVYRFDRKNFETKQKLMTLKPLVLADNQPAIGDQVVSIGYYGNYEFPFNSIGTVAMIDANEDIFSDLTLMPGNSGAPLCDLDTGVVLGVTTEVLDLGNETVRFGIASSVNG